MSNNRNVETSIACIQENKPFKFTSLKEKGNSSQDDFRKLSANFSIFPIMPLFYCHLEG